MSLSKTIIYGSDKEVAREVASGAVLDEIDEYGYTPLVQAAIVNSVNKSEILLKAGANVDFTDLTGRTALFWAADNGNGKLCKLLLKYKADPNSYTLAGQAILVNPLLKHNKAISKLLLAHKANLDFAEDFINAKLVGHNFDLTGRTDIVDDNGTFLEMELEGFYLRGTVDILANSLYDFRRNFAAKNLRAHFSRLNLILNTLDNASKLLQYQDYLLDTNREINRINKLLNTDMLLLPISFAGHAVTLVKMGDYFIRCDRGEFGKKHGTVVIYAMPNSAMFTKTLCRNLLYKRQFPEYVNEGLVRELQLVAKWKLPLSPQISGNCAWANVEAVLPAMLFLLIVEDYGIVKAELAAQEAMRVYAMWHDWNKRRALDFCVQGFYKAKSKARKASKATVLAAIMFQAFKYGRTYDQEQAEKILKVLTNEDYKYILESYVKVFGKDKKDKLWQNLQNFLDDFGIVI